jgi:hypothetical protein
MLKHLAHALRMAFSLLFDRVGNIFMNCSIVVEFAHMAYNCSFRNEIVTYI